MARICVQVSAYQTPEMYKPVMPGDGRGEAVNDAVINTNNVAFIDTNDIQKISAYSLPLVPNAKSVMLVSNSSLRPGQQTIIHTPHDLRSLNVIIHGANSPAGALRYAAPAKGAAAFGNVARPVVVSNSRTVQAANSSFFSGRAAPAPARSVSAPAASASSFSFASFFGGGRSK